MYINTAKNRFEEYEILKKAKDEIIKMKDANQTIHFKDDLEMGIVRSNGNPVILINSNKAKHAIHYSIIDNLPKIFEDAIKKIDKRISEIKNEIQEEINNI